MKRFPQLGRMWPIFALLLMGGLVVVILGPVYRRVQQNTTHRTCYNNLRQIALAIQQYRVDYNGRLPRVIQHPASSTRTDSTLAYGWADGLQIYFAAPRLYQCPQEKRQGDGPFEPWESGYSDYYLNSRLSGINTDKVKFPANTVLLAEGNDGRDVADARYARSAPPPLWYVNRSSPLFRHSARSNYAFLDGHVKQLPVKSGWPSSKPDKDNFTFVPQEAP